MRTENRKIHTVFKLPFFEALSSYNGLWLIVFEIPIEVGTSNLYIYVSHTTSS